MDYNEFELFLEDEEFWFVKFLVNQVQKLMELGK